MNAVERFARYAMAFEEAFASDRWEPLGDYFGDEAVYETFGGGPLAGRAKGRDAVVARLRRLVAALDRRFDQRLPEILEGPCERDGGVWIRFGVTYTRAGLPDLRVSGDHTTYFCGERICRIEEYVPTSVGRAVDAYLTAHAARLRPATDDLPPSEATMRTLVHDYAAAKSRQDIDGALALCSEDFALETVALGTHAFGQSAARLHLGIFFRAFPDYRAVIDGMAAAEGTLAAWGRASLTFAGGIGELPPTGRVAELPIFCVFTFSRDRIRSERFVFDLATLCEQTGLALDPIRASAATLRM